MRKHPSGDHETDGPGCHQQLIVQSRDKTGTSNYHLFTPPPHKDTHKHSHPHKRAYTHTHTNTYTHTTTYMLTHTHKRAHRLTNKKMKWRLGDYGW